MFRFLILCGLLLQGILLRAEVRDLKAFFQARCAVCHGLDGSGRGPGGLRLGPRNLASARWLTQQDQEDLVAILLRGRSAMPGFQRQLSEAEARRLLAEVVRPMAAKNKS